MTQRLGHAALLLSLFGVFAFCVRPAEAARSQQPGGLKLQVIAPDPSSIGDRMSLDVSYRGGSVEAVEVYLDGALVAKRQLGAALTHGVITFTLETMLLTEGNHDLLIKAFGPDGRSVEAPARIRIPGPDLSAPVRIAYPQNGITVSGVVPIRVKVDPDLQRQKPYVTFFINRELKVLRNFPPYEYNWDTTKYANGWHVLEAWTQSADMAEPYKSRPVNVSVNNSGGLTQRQTTIEDLRPASPKPSEAVKPEPKPAGPPIPEAQRSIVLAPEPSSAQQTPGKPVHVAQSPTATGSTRWIEPSSAGRASATLPRVAAPKVAAVPDRLPRVAPSLVGAAAAAPALRRTAPPAPRQTTVKVNHGETLAAVSRKTGADVTEIARLNNLPAKPKSTLPAGRSLIVPQVGAFDVAFDGVLVAFDVTPRFDGGVGLAPMRQIFECTGGRLYWYGSTAQTVRAVNDTREIQLKIGSDRALVNNRTIKLERKPFIESGRTLVPISFMRDALDVNVNYDANSGRMSIRSK
jgi:LysM repeat protein